MMTRICRNRSPCALLLGPWNGATAMQPRMPVSQKIQTRTTTWLQQSHFWVYVQENWKQVLKELSAYPCSQQHYSQKPKAEGEAQRDQPPNVVRSISSVSLGAVGLTQVGLEPGRAGRGDPFHCLPNSGWGLDFYLRLMSLWHRH